MKGFLRERHREGEKQPTRSYSDKQEKEVAKSLQGKQTISSGSTPFSKGDVLLDNFLLECKTKTSHSDSISVKKQWLEKNRSEALFMGKKYNALAFNFGPGEENFYIIDEALFEFLIEYLNSK